MLFKIVQNIVKPRTRNILIAVVVVVLLCVVGFILLPKQPNTQQNYLTEEVKKGDVVLTVSASGKVLSKNTQNATAQMTGKIGLVNVQAGDKVVKNQVLAEFESADQNKAVEDATKAFNSAASNRNKVKAGNQADPTYQMQLKAAQGAVDAAKKNLDKMYELLEKVKILAPFDGEITVATAKVGDLLTMGQSGFVVQSPLNLEIQLQVNEIDIANVKVGQNVTATIDAVRSSRIGKVRTIVNSADIVSGVVTYLVKVDIEDVSKLRSGMTVNGEIDVESKRDVVVVSAGAVKARNGKSYVKVITGKNQDGTDKVEEREVTIGLNNNTIAEVVSGLSVGDKVQITLDTKKPTSLFGG